MPRRKKGLPFGVTSFWPLRISDDEWKKLETHYGFEIPRDLRSAVVAKTQTMCWRSEALQSALPPREAIKRVARIKRAAVDWLKWTDGLPPEIEAMIMSVENSERAELVINPFMKGIVASCDEWLAELDLMSKGTQEASHPQEDWIVELIKLFKRYKLPTAARKDVDKNKNRPSHFVNFVYKLLELIGRKPHSVQAVADAINSARNRVRKPVRARRWRANRQLSGRKRKAPLPNKPRKHR
jgi:hypothetical protein